MSHTSFPTHLGTFYPAGSGRSFGAGFGALGRKRAANDPIGNTSVTFEGLPANVEIRVYDPDLNELAGIELSAANQVLTWPVYAAGSPNNNVQIKLVSTAYKIMDFPYVSKVGSQSIPIQMSNDSWYSNPA